MKHGPMSSRIFNIEGYTNFNYYRKFIKKKACRCSGGVVLFIRNTISCGVSIVKNHLDSVIWIKLDRVFFFHFDLDIFIAGLYVWPENFSMYDYFDTDFLYLLQSDIYEYETQGKVLLCGDWNARTGARADYISLDRNTNFIDDDCYSPDLPMSRDTVDNACNSHGLKLLTLCKIILCLLLRAGCLTVMIIHLLAIMVAVLLII